MRPHSAGLPLAICGGVRVGRCTGCSLIETLVALALVATSSAVLLPALAAAARLQRESALETLAVSIAAARLESLAADVAAGRMDAGGDVDAAVEGWHETVDRSGMPGGARTAGFETRWQVAPAPAPAGVLIVIVRVLPLAARAHAVTFSLAVPDG
jgi:type II secretory pathway pseudopilin PulG